MSFISSEVGVLEVPQLPSAPDEELLSLGVQGPLVLLQCGEGDVLQAVVVRELVDCLHVLHQEQRSQATG